MKPDPESLLLLVSISWVFWGWTNVNGTPPANSNCRACHSCENPSAPQPCLKPCPTLARPTSVHRHGIAEAPDSLRLKKLSKLYGPVRFNHKHHAGMARMGGDCATCHHYSPAGKIPPCGECHPEKAGGNLRQPTLKGAYHRQCLSCHREWNHETQCVFCHAPLEGRVLESIGSDSTDIIGASHPVVTRPDKKVYRTPYEKGSVVTFDHREHIDLFGLRCADCHRKENCGNCHDLKKEARRVRTQEELHGVCNDCHKKDACAKCHGETEKGAFSHASTGWSLNRFHAKLDCRACHPTGKKIARLNTQCTACHAGWSADNFDHGVTGVVLDDDHRELDCADCHGEKDFSKAPSCAGCHDDGRTGKTFLPGKKKGGFGVEEGFR